jgi:hypothetical protein
MRYLEVSGGFGGFNLSLELSSLPPDSLANEFIAFSMYVSFLFLHHRLPFNERYSSNGAQIIHSLLYLKLIYNITLISQETNWGKLDY